MTCRLLQNIKHSCEYNGGGITDVYLLDIRDFECYRFAEDVLFSNCYVNLIHASEPFWEIGAVSESSFSETQENGLYKQQLTTFIHTIEGEKSSNLLLASANKYVVAYRNSQGRMYSFGSDGGASLSFTQVSGAMGETAGYQVILSKNSVYPLFEIDASKFSGALVLGTEAEEVIVTEINENAVLIY